MGIRGLNSIINKYSPDAITQHPVEYYTNTRFAIDSSLLLYKFKYANQSENSHLNGLMGRVLFFLKNHIKPIFVFDGVPPLAKKDILLKRSQHKKKLEEKLEKLQEETTIDTEQVEKLNKQLIYINRYHRDESKRLLRLLGIPIIEADGEAEATCSWLNKMGIVDYTFTEDTDSLTFGAPFIIKYNRQSNRMYQTDLYKILETLKLTTDQFIDFCILCGCDYSITIPKVGPITSLHLIQKYENIENILQELSKPSKKIHIPDNFNYQEARKLFKATPNISEFKDSDFEFGEFDEKGLLKFLVDEKGFDDRTTKSYICKFVNYMSSFVNIHIKTFTETEEYKSECPIDDTI